MMVKIVTSKIQSYILKVIFHNLYHSFAWLYDLVAWIASAGKWTQWVNTSLPYIVGPRILELGFGPGHLQGEMVSSDHDIFGLDESHQMVKVAIKNIQRHKKEIEQESKRNSLVQGKSQFLPYATGTFSTVVSTFPSPYIIDINTVSEIERVLLPGGKLIIIIGAKITGKRLIEKIAAWLMRITHQSLDNGEIISIPFTSSAFTFQLLEINLVSSLVFLIQAVKV